MGSALEIEPASANLDAWRALAAEAVEPNPFFEPEVLLPAARSLAGGGRVQLLVTRDGRGRWTGLLPVLRTSQWRRMPGSAAGAWMHPYCFLGTPLVARGAEEPALTSLLAALRRASALVHFEQVPADGPVADALEAVLASAGLRPVVWSAFERAALSRRPGGDYLQVALAPKRRRELRRQRNLLAAELGGELECADVAGDPAGVEAFLALEAAGWKGRSGTAMDLAGAGAFFRDLCAAAAAAGQLQLLLLRCGDRVVAAKANLLAGGAVFCFKIAYDEDLARFSPGVQLEADNVAAFHARPDLEWMDSCADPGNQMINRLWTGRRRLTTLLVPGAGPTGWAMSVQARTAAGVRQRLKEPR